MRNNARAIRETKGFTVEYIAEKAKVTTAEVKDFEEGYPVTTKVIESVAEALGEPLSMVLN